jgi:hypothetical protein
MNSDIQYPICDHPFNHGTRPRRDEHIVDFLALLAETEAHESESLASARQRVRHLEPALELLKTEPTCSQLAAYSIKPISNVQLTGIAFSGISPYPADTFSATSANQSVSVSATAVGNHTETRIFDVKIQINDDSHQRIFRSLPIDLRDLLVPSFDDPLDRQSLFGIPLISFGLPLQYVPHPKHHGFYFQIVRKSYFKDKPPIYERVEEIVETLSVHDTSNLLCFEDAMAVIRRLVKSDRDFIQVSGGGLAPDYFAVRHRINTFSERIRRDEICEFVWLTPDEWRFIPEAGGAFVVGVVDGIINQVQRLKRSVHPKKISEDDREMIMNLFGSSDQVVVGIFNGSSSGCNRFFPTSVLSLIESPDEEPYY